MNNDIFFKNIIITGGIGDFLAIDSFLSHNQKRNIRKIILATRAFSEIKSLFDVKNTYYSKLKKINVLNYDFSDKPSFHSKEMAKELISINTSFSPSFWDNIYDGSISNIFKLIRSKDLKFHGSSFLNLNVNIKKFKIPKDFLLILPFSKNKTNENRNFNDNDWDNLECYLKTNKKLGVCIGAEKNNEIPQSKFLINLINQTTILESIEILKKSIGYIGIDSWISVLAPKILNRKNIYIKTNSKHCFRFSSIYFKPYVTKNFIFSDLKEINKFQKKEL